MAKINEVMALYPNFQVQGTGGGCEAWVHPLKNGGQIMVTAVDDPSLPEENDVNVDLGVYDEDMDEAVETHFGIAVNKLEKTIDRILGFK